MVQIVKSNSTENEVPKEPYCLRGGDEVALGNSSLANDTVDYEFSSKNKSDEVSNKIFVNLWALMFFPGKKVGIKKDPRFNFKLYFNKLSTSAGSVVD